MAAIVRLIASSRLVIAAPSTMLPAVLSFLLQADVLGGADHAIRHGHALPCTGPCRAVLGPRGSHCSRVDGGWQSRPRRRRATAQSRTTRGFPGYHSIADTTPTAAGKPAECCARELAPRDTSR